MLARAAVLLVVTLLASLPHLLLTGWCGTEGRRVQIALEMLQSGEWMVPTIGFQPTWAKPPLHYWILAGAHELLGAAPWLLRLPSVLALFLTALCAMALLRRWFGAAAGWVGALGVLCSPIIVFEWATAEIDPIFAALCATSLWCLATGVARERRGLMVAAGLLGGLALLQKGPPYFVFAAGAWLVWWRRRGLRGAFAYLLPLLLLPLAYYVPLWFHHVAHVEMLAVARAESIGRAGEFTLRHLLDTPGFWLRAALVQLPLVLWCFWEWRGARDARMDGNDLTLRMCSGAAVFAVVILTFFPGRPTRYLLPNIPLFTFAVAPAVAHFAAQPRLLGAFSRRVLRGAAIAASGALVAVPLFADHVGSAVAGVLLVVALAPRLVWTRRQLVGFMLLLPVFGGWTAGAERAAAWHASHRAAEPVGRALRRELQARGIDPAELATYGHVDGRMLLGAGLLPRGDEACAGRPNARWLLTSAGGVTGAGPTGHAERLGIVAPAGRFVLWERHLR